MSPELEQKLIEKYSILFKGVNGSPQETCMCFGIEFQDGWYKLLDELCEYITRLSNRKELVMLKEGYKTEDNHNFMYIQPPTISFTQVKEKFGMMRIYWKSNGVDNWEELCEKVNQDHRESAINKYFDRVQDAIDYVEFLSSKVCEKCGQPGEMRKDGWLKVRCDNCYEEIPKL